MYALHTFLCMCYTSHMKNKRKEFKAPPERDAYKLAEAAHKLGGISVASVRRLIKRGLLDASKSLRHPLVPASEIQRFLRETGGGNQSARQ